MLIQEPLPASVSLLTSHAEHAETSTDQPRTSSYLRRDKSTTTLRAAAWSAEFLAPSREGENEKAETTIHGEAKKESALRTGLFLNIASLALLAPALDRAPPQTQRFTIQL